MEKLVVGMGGGGEGKENCWIGEATHVPPQFYMLICICTFNKSESDVSVNEAVDVDLLKKAA